MGMVFWMEEEIGIELGMAMRIKMVIMQMLKIMIKIDMHNESDDSGYRSETD